METNKITWASLEYSEDLGSYSVEVARNWKWPQTYLRQTLKDAAQLILDLIEEEDGDE